MSANALTLSKTYMTYYFKNDLAEAVIFRTHNRNILGWNPAVLSIFFKDSFQVIGNINTHIFSIYKYIINVRFLLLLVHLY